jgi:hypothetical protein
MSFEFNYDGDWYKYENGYIKKQYGLSYYDFLCPVPAGLKGVLEDLSVAQCQSIMEAILHVYFFGIQDGKLEKINEFKRVLNIN